MTDDEEFWFDAEDEGEDDDGGIVEYEIAASPNDFNTKTIFDFIESGSVVIPAFQRNYVWDIRRASKLIESLIIGIPVPQIFLYEETRNRFLVIDGQQRLMSIFYFIKQRFPRKEKRSELRRIFDENGKIPDEILHDDDYFDKFNLSLPSKMADNPNRLHRLNYSTLDELKTTFDLRTIRNIIIKQLKPENDDSCIYELFNRLNTGGMNLTPQEIRASIHHSKFFEMLHRANADQRWRELLGVPDPDLRMKDIEILLRGFAMLVARDEYKPSMARFLNRFSRSARKFDAEQVAFLESLFKGFLQATKELTATSFHGKTGRKFNISMYEAIFTTACADAFASRTKNVATIDADRALALRDDEEFAQLTKSKAADTSVIKARLKKAREILLPSNGA